MFTLPRYKSGQDLEAYKGAETKGYVDMHPAFDAIEDKIREIDSRFGVVDSVAREQFEANAKAIDNLRKRVFDLEERRLIAAWWALLRFSGRIRFAGKALVHELRRE